MAIGGGDQVQLLLERVGGGGGEGSLREPGSWTSVEGQWYLGELVSGPSMVFYRIGLTRKLEFRVDLPKHLA